MAQKQFGEIVNNEHISDRDGENINAKRIGLYGYDYGNSQWRRLAVNSSGSLLSSLYVLKAGDTMTGDLAFTTGNLWASKTTDIGTTDITIAEFGEDTGFVYNNTPLRLFWSNPDSGAGFTGGVVQFDTGDPATLLPFAAQSFYASNLVANGVVFASGGALVNEAAFTYGVSTNLLTLQNSNITTTSTPSVRLENSTASTSGATVQYSPAQDFIGHAWTTALGGADRTIRFRQEVQGTSAATPISTLVWKSSMDSGTASFTDRMTLNSSGQLTLPTSGSSAGTLWGTDFQIYRRTTNIGSVGSGDSFEIPDANFAVGSTIANTDWSIYGLKTATGNTSSIGVRGTVNITGSITSAFPRGGSFNVAIDSGANTQFYSTGVLFSNRVVVTQSGAISEMYGADFDIWHAGSANIGTFANARGFGNIVAGSSGTITSWDGSRAILNTNSATTFNITDATNASPIVITTSGAHGYSTGMSVTVAGVLGNTAANGNWIITVLTTTTFSLNGSTGSGAYTSGGTVVLRSANVTAGRGFYTVLSHSGTNTIGSFFGTDTSLSFASGSGAITNLYHHFVRNPGSNATITTQYGFYAQALSRASNNYAIGTEGGNVHGFGTVTPVALIQGAGGLTKTAWTTSGVGLRMDAATHTDSSSTGTVAGVTVHNFGTPTLAASSSTTYTDASTFRIAAAPIAGTNVVITNPWTFWIDSGNALFDGNLRFSTAGSVSSTNVQMGAATAGFYYTGTDAIGLSISSTSIFSANTTTVTLNGYDSTATTGALLIRGADFTSKSGNGGNVSFEMGAAGSVSGTPGTIKIFESDGSSEQLGFTENTGLVVNEGGLSDIDFRIETDTLTHALFVDAGTDQVYIGQSSGNSQLDVNLDARARQLIADGDSAGVASTTSLTNGTDTLDETANSILTRAGNASSAHTGYIKIYIGTTAYYVPYFN